MVSVAGTAGAVGVNCTEELSSGARGTELFGCTVCNVEAFRRLEDRRVDLIARTLRRFWTLGLLAMSNVSDCETISGLDTRSVSVNVSTSAAKIGCVTSAPRAAMDK